MKTFIVEFISSEGFSCINEIVADRFIVFETYIGFYLDEKLVHVHLSEFIKNINVRYNN